MRPTLLGLLLLVSAPSSQGTPAIASPAAIQWGESVLLEPLRHGTFANLHGAGRAVRVPGFPLPGRVGVDLAFVPLDSPVGTARIVGEGGEETRYEPSVRFFRLVVEGEEGHGILGVARSQAHGFLRLGNASFSLSSGSVMGGAFAITRLEQEGSTDLGPVCATRPQHEAPGFLLGEGPTAAPTGERPVLRTALLFLEVDRRLNNAFDSPQDAADYAALLAGVSSEIYHRDLGVRLVVPDDYLRVWTSPTPWAPLTFALAPANLAAWWNSAANPDRDKPRALVQALTRRANAATGGFNWGFANGIGVSCRPNQAYAVSSLVGTFPYPHQHTGQPNADLYLFCHEAAHVFGSLHTFQYAPAIPCIDGTGPDEGTLMSYCYETRPFSLLGMRFHPRVQARLRARARSQSCFGIQPIALGDYDGDGRHGAADVWALQSYLRQGFLSRGAHEVFDLDQDGDVDEEDRRQLDALIRGRSEQRR